MKDGRGKRKLWSALVSDPYRKLASVALAIGLWYFLDSQISRDFKVTAALRAANEVVRPEIDNTPGNTLEVLLPLARVAVSGFRDPSTQQPIKEVVLKFSGPKYLVDNLQGDRQLILSAGPFPGRNWDTADLLEFTAANIVRTSRVLRDLSIVMDPPIVQVMFERKQAQTVTLTKDSVEIRFRNPEDDQRLRDRLRMNHVEFQPEVINVMGPKKQVDHFPGTAAKPFLAWVEPRNQDRQVSGQVTLNNLPSEDQDLELDTSPIVTIELMPRQEVTSLEVPVQVDDLSLSPQLRGHYLPEFPTMKVKIRYSGKLQSILNAFNEQERNQWAAQYLRLAVWIRPRDDDTTFKEDLTVEARLELQGYDDIDHIHYGLVDQVPVHLVRKQQ